VTKVIVISNTTLLIIRKEEPALQKQGSYSTVVWNASEDVLEKMGKQGKYGYRHYPRNFL